MKIQLAFICILFYATCASSHGIRAKRGLTADEQKKLLDVLNKDRQEVGKKYGVKMRTLTYNTTLEKELDHLPQTCHHMSGIYLKWNDNVQKVYENANFPPAHPRPIHEFFKANDTSIACSKTYKCTQVLTKEDGAPPEMVGKTGEFYGVCRLRGDSPSSMMREATLPPLSKYGDILGITVPEGSGSGRIFGMITFLIVMVWI